MAYWTSSSPPTSLSTRFSSCHAACIRPRTGPSPSGLDQRPRLPTRTIRLAAHSAHSSILNPPIPQHYRRRLVQVTRATSTASLRRRHPTLVLPWVTLSFAPCTLTQRENLSPRRLLFRSDISSLARADLHHTTWYLLCVLPGPSSCSPSLSHRLGLGILVSVPCVRAGPAVLPAFSFHTFQILVLGPFCGRGASPCPRPTDVDSRLSTLQDLSSASQTFCTYTFLDIHPVEWPLVASPPVLSSFPFPLTRPFPLIDMSRPSTSIHAIQHQCTSMMIREPGRQ